MIRKNLHALLLLALLLAACAPAVGSSSRNPLRLDSGTIEVHPGQVLFLSGSYSLADVGLTTEALDNVFWVPEGVSQESARALGVVDLEVSRLPAYWELKLAEARFVHRSGETRDAYSLRVLLELTLPADAALGPQVVRAGLKSRSGVKQLEIPLRVRQAQL
jgi:hypothetical protein